MYVVILGPPGAGKGTQAQILSSETGLPRVASGDLFRQALEEGTEFGLVAKSYMEKGLLVPDDTTIDMILGRLEHTDCVSGCILDGFPRNLRQAEILDRALDRRGERVDKAIYIDVDEGELVKRLSGRWLCRNCQAPYHVTSSPPDTPGKCDKCGGKLYQRPDDREGTMRERLSVFLYQTAPILDYYEKQGKLIRIDGNMEVEDVANAMRSAVKESVSS
jgi:adenylate kinase